MHLFYVPRENEAKGMNDQSKMAGQETERDQGSGNGDS